MTYHLSTSAARAEKTSPARSNVPLGARGFRDLRARLLACTTRVAMKALMPKYLGNNWHLQRVLATPAWSSMGRILGVYRLSRKMSIDTGVPHNVDHIVPLTHPRVCGLHVWWNLRVIPAAVDRAKSNHWCPEQGDMFVDPEQLELFRRTI